MSATRQEGAPGVPTLTILSSEELENMRSASEKRAKSCAAKTFLRKGQLNRNTRFGSVFTVPSFLLFTHGARERRAARGARGARSDETPAGSPLERSTF